MCLRLRGSVVVHLAHHVSAIILTMTAAGLASAVAVTAGAVHAQTPAARPGARVPLPGAPAGVLAFVNVGVVPMDQERVLAEQTVLVEHGWIIALGPSSKVKVPAGAVRVDGRGQFLLPGLADMHTHLVQGSDSAQTARLLLAYVASGVTTVRNMDYAYAADGPPVLALRARAAAGELLSPRIYTSGMWGRSKHATAGDQRSDRSTTKPEEVAAQVAEYKAAGYDHLKSREDIDPATAQGRALFDSLVAAAKRLGMPIVGHVIREPGWFERNPAAFKSIEHLSAYIGEIHGVEPLDYAAFYAKLPARVALTKQAGVWNCPTWASFEAWGGKLALDPQAPMEDEVLRQRILRSLGAWRRLIKALQDAGAGLLLGTDIPLQGREPDTLIPQELQALVRAGLTPYQALVTGTRNVAEYYATLPESGTVAVGKRADLVLLGGNPLADIGHVARPAGVMLGGRWLPRAELERRAAELQAAENKTPR